MDFQLCVVSAIAFAFVTSHVADMSTAMGTKLFLLVFLLGYVLVKCYRIFVYPFWVSPLRHLPGPKVRTRRPDRKAFR